MAEYSKISIAHFIVFEDRYAIDARLLGRRIQICISEDSFLRITIPSLVIERRCPKIAIPGTLKRFKSDIDDWGIVKSYVSFDDLDKMDAWISAVLVECFCKNCGSLPNSGIIQAEAKKVLHTLQIINPDAIRIPSDEYKDDMCNVMLSVSLNEKGEALPEIKCPMVFDDGIGKLSIYDIKCAFHNAHNSISAPYEMLNNARINLTHNDTRATVLNCATAIEVMLKRKVSTYLEDNNIPQAIMDYVLKQSDGYDKLIGLCNRFGIKLTGLPDVKKKIVEIRNHVIHGGYIPSNRESQVAYGNTREALRILNVPMFESNAVKT